MDIASSPAQRALASVTHSTGLEPSAKEMPRALRLVARALSPGDDKITDAAWRDILCTVRRKSWASRMMHLARQAHEPWISKEDMIEAAGRIDHPEAGDALLRHHLDVVIADRFREISHVPGDVFAAVKADLSDSGQFLSGQQVDHLARRIAEIFGVKDFAFESELIAQEQAQAAREEEIRRKAAQRQEREIEKLRRWEASLVGFDQIPALLHCSRQEALRWVAENRLPIARRTTQSDGVERFEFDPDMLRKLRHQLGRWRSRQDDATRRPDAPAVGAKIGNAVIARVAALDRYAGHFKTARALKRRLVLITGPTNSGKSHAALDALAEAESGLALAPLRLLAHEFKEALGERGVAASLMTGEECILVPDSRHIAATVEMCPFYTPVDVAIIDEAQMLTDPDRGAAWTAAIMGVPARTVYILGAPDCIPLIRRIASLCNDPLDEVSLARKSPLRAANGPTRLDQLGRSDAVIAFSRRDVLDLRAELMARGRRVAVVYGALSPEVRRAEAARFNRGEADIFVATDAIGMGLNLSIKRVIFSALKKYDGRQSRDLLPQEVKQFGGRAGRYGHHEDGIVGVLAGAGSVHVIDRMLKAPPEPMVELRPLVQPDMDIVRAVADEVGSESLYGVLTRIKRAVLRADDPNYRLADMEQPMEIAAALEGVEGLELSQRWTYAMCPIDERDNGITRLVSWAAEHAAGHAVPPPGTGRLTPPAKAGREELERAEKRHKRLVAWRWLSIRFPEFYRETDRAAEHTKALNDWIESVLRQQSHRRESARHYDEPGSRHRRAGKPSSRPSLHRTRRRS